MQAGDIYDIIIQNLTKEWENSMNNQLSWKIRKPFKYSKKKLTMLGRLLQFLQLNLRNVMLH